MHRTISYQRAQGRLADLRQNLKEGNASHARHRRAPRPAGRADCHA